MTNLGLVYLNQKKLKQAEKYLLQAMEMKKKVYGEDHLELTNIIGNLGVIY